VVKLLSFYILWAHGKLARIKNVSQPKTSKIEQSNNQSFRLLEFKKERDIMYRLVGILIAAIFLISGCNDDDSNDAQKATLSVRLTDAPANYEEVLIDVEEVKVHVGDDTANDENWVSMENVYSGTYNLLDFTNGLDTLIAEDQLPAGTISQMRLVLGDGNQVKTNGTYHDLTIPSGQESGLKFNIHAELIEGVTYKLWIDFDAGRSVVETGSGEFLLKPVIRTYNEATSGAIEGVVMPAVANSYIMAITTDEIDTLGTYAETTTGYFMFQGVDEGTYNLELKPNDEYLDTTLNDVNVMTGQVTYLDTINLERIQ